MPVHEAGKVREQRVVTGQRAIEIEHRQRRGRGSRGR
jgi:hypothetical protein